MYDPHLASPCHAGHAAARRGEDPALLVPKCSAMVQASGWFNQPGWLVGGRCTRSHAALPTPYLFLFFPSPPPAHLLLCIKASSQLHQSLVAAQERATQSAVAGCHHSRRWRGCRPHSSRRPVPRASDAAGWAEPRSAAQGSPAGLHVYQRSVPEG